MKKFLLYNKFCLSIIICFVLGCITFALLYSTFPKSSQKNALHKEKITQTFEANADKKYSGAKDIIKKYSPEDISTFNANELVNNKKITETKKIALNMKSSVDSHLLSVKQAKEQKEKEKQEALKVQQKNKEKAKKKAEAKKKISRTSSQPSRVKNANITAHERDLLERLVEAEAGSEPYEGKLAVATVVMNRVKNNQFPNTIHEVIYQKNQFSPIANGAINQKASNKSKQAVHQVIDNGYRSFEPDVLYFLNPEIATSKWIMENRTFVKTIGCHYFYK